MRALTGGGEHVAQRFGNHSCRPVDDEFKAVGADQLHRFLVPHRLRLRLRLR
jgi:hypothetical protein